MFINLTISRLNAVVVHTSKKTILVSPQDVHEVMKRKWSAHTGRYAKANIGGRHVLLHRYLLGVTDPKVEVDHINRCPWDNRRENLRLATHRENMLNRTKARGTSSRFVGVTYCKRTRRWIAQQKRYGVNRYFGRFDTEELAAEAFKRNAAA